MADVAPKRRKKPSKPYPSFPLTAHNNGQWCKKIRGKVRFFGTWDDHKAALERYLQVANDLHRGRQPTQFTLSGRESRVKDVCNHYLTDMWRRVEATEITPQWYADCRRTLTDFAAFTGSERPVSDLHPLDFDRYRQKLRRCGLKKGRGGLGAHGLDRSVTIVRAAFVYAYEMEIIDRPARFGRSFKRSSVIEKRRARAASVRENGLRCFTPESVREMLSRAGCPLRTMILLGVNGGFGNSDCGLLPRSAVDFGRGVIDFPRPKSGIDRIVPLWPETRDSLSETLKQRPEASCTEAQNLVFLTRFGRPWIHRKSAAKESRTDSIGQEFDKLLLKLGVKRKRLGFYALRHTFRTWADEVNDQHAIHRIMGHVVPGMSGIYVQEIGLDRLRRVVEHVRRKLFEEDCRPCLSSHVTVHPKAIQSPTSSQRITTTRTKPTTRVRRRDGTRVVRAAAHL